MSVRISAACVYMSVCGWFLLVMTDGPQTYSPVYEASATSNRPALNPNIKLITNSVASDHGTLYNSATMLGFYASDAAVSPFHDFIYVACPAEIYFSLLNIFSVFFPVTTAQFLGAAFFWDTAYNMHKNEQFQFEK